jgi:hypothetical protein
MLVCMCLCILASSRIPLYSLGRRTPHPEVTLSHHPTPAVISPPQHRLPSLLRPIKGIERLTICHHIHSPPSVGFLLRKNLLLLELKSWPPSLLTARPHPSLCHPKVRPVRSSESPSSSLSIHNKLPCITIIARSNFGEFFPLQVHRESNVSHSLQSLDSIHVISYMKINLNFKKNSKTLHQHPYLFEKFCFNLWFWIKFDSKDILKSRSIAQCYQLVYFVSNSHPLLRSDCKKYTTSHILNWFDMFSLI